MSKIKLICTNAYEIAHSTSNDKPMNDEEKYARLGFTVERLNFLFLQNSSNFS